MSAGHRHRRPNPLSHTRELHKLLRIGGAPALMKRFQKLDLDHDCPYLCGYNVTGTTRFVDRDFARALFDPAYAEKLIGAAIDTGMSPEDTLECLLTHEAIEKTITDADNPIDTYLEAHEFATAGEHEIVVKKRGTPAKYERGLERAIKFCLAKPLKTVAQDYACAPALDEPDANDKRILAELKRLGVTDASKLSKEDVDYGLSRSAEHCADCSMWMAARGGVLSPCSLVNGLVRADRTCDRFEPRGKDDQPQDQGQEGEEGAGAAGSAEAGMEDAVH